MLKNRAARRRQASRKQPSRKNLRPDIAAKAQRIRERLQVVYAVGRHALQKEEESLSTGAYADTYGFNEHTLRRMKAFAAEFTATASGVPVFVADEGEQRVIGEAGSDLHQLCQMTRPVGLPLHFGHVCYSLAIKSRSTRFAMLKKAARLGWSPAMLHREITLLPAKLKRRQKPVRHGRTMKAPLNLLEGL